MASIELTYVTISFDAPIVYFNYMDGAELGSAQMKELVAAAEKLSWSRPYFTFSDVRVKMSVTPDGRRYIGDLQHMPFFRGAAVIVKNNAMKFSVNFLSYFSKSKYPMKAFTDEQKALQWLKSLPLDDAANGWHLM